MRSRSGRPPIPLADNGGASLLPRISIEMSRRALWKNLNTAHLKPNELALANHAQSANMTPIALQSWPATGIPNLLSNDR